MPQKLVRLIISRPHSAVLRLIGLKESSGARKRAAILPHQGFRLITSTKRVVCICYIEYAVRATVVVLYIRRVAFRLVCVRGQQLFCAKNRPSG